MRQALVERLGALRDERAWSATGSVTHVSPSGIAVGGLRLSVGDALTITTTTGTRHAEVVSLDDAGAHALLFGDTRGIGRGDRVVVDGDGMTVDVSAELIGRTIDGLGRPIDGLPPSPGGPVSLTATTPSPLERVRIDAPIQTGVKVIDTFCTTGRGQRLGIFGGSGVGKSTLLGMMARGTAADVVVLALVGERGREVREFIEDELGPEGMRNAILVVATSDEPPLVRLRAALLATRIAEWFADDGADVLLMMDSLTRLAMAQREIGLAAGEPPTSRGYTPSVFSMLATLLERAGPRRAGTITAFYTVLVEGDDMNDPIADAARSILDGHIVLDRRLAIAGRYPAIDPLASLSRIATKLVDPSRLALVAKARDAMAAADEVRELVEVGAYAPGSNPAADRGLAVMHAMIDYLAQPAGQVVGFETAWSRLEALRPVLEGTSR